MAEHEVETTLIRLIKGDIKVNNVIGVKIVSKMQRDSARYRTYPSTLPSTYLPKKRLGGEQQGNTQCFQVSFNMQSYC